MGQTFKSFQETYKNYADNLVFVRTFAPCFYHSQEDMLTTILLSIKKGSDIIFDASLTSLRGVLSKEIEVFLSSLSMIFKILLPVASLNENF